MNALKIKEECYLILGFYSPVAERGGGAAFPDEKVFVPNSYRGTKIKGE